MISTQYSPEHYTGDGTTANLPFTWRILAKTDVIVLAKDADGVVTTLVLDTDFTIADADVNTDDGGDVVLTTPATWDTQDIFIIRNTARTQIVNIEEGAAFPAATIVKEFDRLTMIAQELYYRERKALKFAAASTVVDVDVPDPEDFKFLTWLSGALINSAAGFITASTAVTAGSATVSVVFATALSNANYTVLFITPDWLATGIASNKTTAGFDITFDNEAPVGGGNVVTGVVQ